MLFPNTLGMLDDELLLFCWICQLATKAGIAVRLENQRQVWQEEPCQTEARKVFSSTRPTATQRGGGFRVRYAGWLAECLCRPVWWWWGSADWPCTWRWYPSYAAFTGCYPLWSRSWRRPCFGWFWPHIVFEWFSWWWFGRGTGTWIWAFHWPIVPVQCDFLWLSIRILDVPISYQSLGMCVSGDGCCAN